MTRGSSQNSCTWLTRALPLAVTLATAGCSAPQNCASDGYLDSAQTITSDSLSGTTTLVRAGDTASIDLDAALGGLPKLWPADSAIVACWLKLELTLGYESAPYGGDGQTEMPAVRIDFDTASGDYTTPAFPRMLEATASALFTPCDRGTTGHCCPFGARQCEEPVHVVLTRVDGAPFPPVKVTWSAQATATLQQCPSTNGPEPATLSLTSNAP